jgi:hypothetical protein
MKQTKICSCCNVEKHLDDYYEVKRKTPLVRKIKTDNRKAMCKQCYTARAKKWSSENKERRKEISKRYSKNNIEKIVLARKERYQRADVKEKSREYRLKNVTRYLRERRQSDPLFAFKIKTRNLIRKAFDRNGFTKRSKSNDILGCSWPEFISHMEKQFKEGMTWHNRGEWHIDHIIPLATATCEDDIIRLNHFTNLRPLWAEENLRKSDKLEFIL